MKFAVYWQPGNDIEIIFYATEQEARQKIAALIDENDERFEGEVAEDWDITLLEIRGEVKRTIYGSQVFAMRQIAPYPS